MIRFPTMTKGALRRPVIPLIIEAPNGIRVATDALMDTGADLTLLSNDIAAKLGVDLSTSRPVPVTSALGQQLTYTPFTVVLELRSYPDLYRWRTRVGFSSHRTRASILGTRGFFEFFRVRYDWSADLIEIEPIGPLPP